MCWENPHPVQTPIWGTQPDISQIPQFPNCFQLKLPASIISRIPDSVFHPPHWLLYPGCPLLILCRISKVYSFPLPPPFTLTFGTKSFPFPAPNSFHTRKHLADLSPLSHYSPELSSFLSFFHFNTCCHLSSNLSSLNGLVLPIPLPLVTSEKWLGLSHLNQAVSGGNKSLSLSSPPFHRPALSPYLCTHAHSDQQCTMLIIWFITTGFLQRTQTWTFPPQNLQESTQK